jgi:hypothetical protein
MKFSSAGIGGVYLTQVLPVGLLQMIARCTAAHSKWLFLDWKGHFPRLDA